MRSFGRTKTKVMRIEQQVNSIEQGKRLQELGIEGIPIFTHIRYDEYPSTCIPSGYYDDNAPEYKPYDCMGEIHEEYPAFTVAELGVMLPTLGFEYAKSNNGNGDDFFWLSSSYWRLKGVELSNESEAVARAATLIYLLENGHVTPEECNERLSK